MLYQSVHVWGHMGPQVHAALVPLLLREAASAAKLASYGAAADSQGFNCTALVGVHNGGGESAVGSCSPNLRQDHPSGARARVTFFLSL
jgi:hypothetical protein